MDDTFDRPSTGGFSPLLNKVVEACRLHHDQIRRPDPGIERLFGSGPGPRLEYLRVVYTQPGWPVSQVKLIGVYDGPVTDAVVGQFAELISGKQTDGQAHLISRAEPDADLKTMALGRGIWVRGFDAYQAALWNSAQFLARQAARLQANPGIPVGSVS